MFRRKPKSTPTSIIHLAGSQKVFRRALDIKQEAKKYSDKHYMFSGKPKSTPTKIRYLAGSQKVFRQGLKKNH